MIGMELEEKIDETQEEKKVKLKSLFSKSFLKFYIISIAYFMLAEIVGL